MYVLFVLHSFKLVVDTYQLFLLFKSFYILFIYYLFSFLSVFLFSFHFVYVCVCIEYSLFSRFYQKQHEQQCFTIGRPDSVLFFRLYRARKNLQGSNSVKKQVDGVIGNTKWPIFLLFLFYFYAIIFLYTTNK